MAGLTSLFGMGRGEHRRDNHHKKVKLQTLNPKVQGIQPAGCWLDFVILPYLGFLNNVHIGIAISFRHKIKLKLTGN